MADLNEKVILEVNLDTTQVNDKLAVVLGNIDAVKKQLKDIETQKKAFASQGKDVSEFNKQIVVLQNSLRSLGGEQKNLQRQVDLNTKANQAAKGSYEELLRNYTLADAKLKQLGGTIQKNANGQFELTAEFHKQSKEVGDAREAINKFNLTLNNGSTNTGNYKKSLEGLKFAHERINKSASGIASVFSVLAITQGEDSKATQLQRNAMLALTAVQEISNIRMGIANTLIGAQSIRTALLSTAVKSQTIFQGILNTVTTLFPGAALVLAITAIVQVVGQWLGKTDEMTAKQKEQNAELERTKKLIEDSTKSFTESLDRLNSDDRNEKIINNAKTQIELVKLRGGTLTEVFNLEAGLIDKQLDMYERARQTDKIEYTNLLNQKKILTANYYNDLAVLQGERAAKEIEAMKEQAELQKEAIAAVNGPGELEEIVNGLLRELELNAQIQSDITKTDKEESEKRKQIAREETQEKIALLNAEADLADAKASFVKSGAIQLRQFAVQNSAVYKGLFLTEKAAAISEIIIQLNAEIARISAANAVLGAAGIPLTIAQSTAAKIRAGIGIASIAVESFKGFAPAFAEGGLSGKRIGSGDGAPIHRSNGDNLLATVRVGEVILNEQQQAKLGGAATFSRIGVPGFTGGGITSDMLAFADGGFAARTVSQPVLNSVSIQNVQDIASIFGSLPAPIVRVTDINSVNGKLIAVSDRANT